MIGFKYYHLQVNAAAEVIYDLVDPTANLIFGAVIDPSLSGQVSYTMQTLEYYLYQQLYVNIHLPLDMSWATLHLSSAFNT